MKILLVSQMYPSPSAPDFGVFVRDVERALVDRGNDIERVVIDRREGGRRRHADLARRTRTAVQRFRPDVVYAHMLVPAGLAAAVSTRTPLVVTAHGQDVANIGRIRGVGSATRLVCRRATAVICVSDYLRRKLEARVPEARGKTSVIDCGVDLTRFSVSPALPEPTAYLFVGSLIERKNVERLAAAFALLDDEEATLTIVGDGPLRARFEGLDRVLLTGALPHDEIAARVAAAHVVCQPSLVEPFGQALLEAMACGRTVVATCVGGASELVPDGAGILVDPLDVGAIAAALREAAGRPCPNLAARAAAESHDVRRQAERIEAVLASAAQS